MLIAQERLNEEHDIQHIIKMNRVTRLLHKVHFLTRQRLIMAYKHKYVISADDIEKSNKEVPRIKTDSALKKTSDSEIKQRIDFLLDGFNADTNDIDRRIYYEVTRSQIREGEFDNEDTSEDELSYFNRPDPLAHALN